MFRVLFFSLIFIFTLSAKGMAPVSELDIDRHHKSNKNTRQGLLQTEAMIQEAMEQSGNSESLSWRLARNFFWLAQRSAEESAKQATKDYYHSCIRQADQAIQLNNRSAWGFFFRGICRGKLGEMQGIWSSLSMIEPLKQDLKKALKLDPSVSQGGPHRALGKLYLELPGLLGGSVNKSVNHLRQAIVLGPRFAENYLFLADALYEQENYQAAKSTLKSLLKIIEESNDDETEAQKIRAKVQTLMQKIDPWIEAQTSHAQ